MPRTVFSLLSLAACVSLSTACSSTPPPTGGGSGSGAMSGSGSASGVSTGGMTGSASGGATGGAMCSGSTTTAMLSFKNDIMPIFRSNCAKPGACHNDPSTYTTAAGGGGRPYLGTAIDGGAETMADIGIVYQGLMKPSLEYKTPQINYVKGCDPAMSFLMLKMDPSFTTLDMSHCVHGDFSGFCGLPMPSDSTTGSLPQATRDMVRNWISQGAMNN